MKQYPTSRGRRYLSVRPYINGKQSTFYVHRLVAEAFLPNPNNLPQVNHKDGHPNNNRVENLEWVSCSENIQHAYRTGLIDLYSNGLVCSACGKKIGNTSTVPYCRSCFEKLIRENRKKQKRQAIKENFVESLTGREREIMELWVDGATQVQIANRYGVSHQRINQIVKQLIDLYENSTIKAPQF